MEDVIAALSAEMAEEKNMEYFAIKLGIKISIRIKLFTSVQLSAI